MVPISEHLRFFVEHLRIIVYLRWYEFETCTDTFDFFVCTGLKMKKKNVSKYRWKICIIQFACNFLCTEVQHDLIIFQSKNSMLNGQNNYWNVLRWLICTNLWFYIFGFRINPTDYLFVYWKKKNDILIET